MYAIISEGLVTEYPITDLSSRFPQISFPSPMVDTALPDGVVRVALEPAPAYDPHTHRLVKEAPVCEGGQWLVRYSVVPLDADELAAIQASRAATARSERTQKLQRSDWTQLADAPVDKAAWAAYRQALRDVPSQPGFPTTIDWPQEP